MKVLNMQPAANSSGGAMKLVAEFDLQIAEDIRICGMRLLQAPDGRLLSYAPTALGGRRSVTFAPETAAAITGAATRQYYSEPVTAHDCKPSTAD